MVALPSATSPSASQLRVHTPQDESSAHSAPLRSQQVIAWDKLVRLDCSGAWAGWSVLLAAVSAFVMFGPKRSVTPAYFYGASQWLAGATLYGDTGEGFLYLPQAAIAFIPFAFWPFFGDVLWRFVTIGTFAWGLYRLSLLAQPTSPRPVFGLATLISIPLAWCSAQNGQSTLPLAGLSMIAIAEISVRHWWRAALCLTLAIALKPLALVLILLSAALYRPMIGRLLVCMAVMAVVPFFTQRPDYVLSQYLDFKRMLSLASIESNLSLYAQLFGMLRVAGVTVSENSQTVVRGAFALVTLGVCWWYRPRFSPERWSLYFYAVSSCYLLLFNPRTENNTYSLLAPAIGISLVNALNESRGKLRCWLLVLMSIGILGTFEIGRLFTPKSEAIWLAPMMCIAFLVYSLNDMRQSRLSDVAAFSHRTATHDEPSSIAA